MEALKTVNLVIGLAFLICYFYQFFYIPIPWLLRRRQKPQPTQMSNRYAVLICARNEAEVIGGLLGSLRGQTYAADRLRVFVLADNCTDATAAMKHTPSSPSTASNQDRSFRSQS